MYIIDRIESGYAVVETDGGMENIPLTELPAEVREGDVLQKTDAGWQIDAEGTQARREQLIARRRRLLNGGGE